MYKIQPPEKDYRGYAGIKYSKLPFLLAVISAVLALIIKLLSMAVSTGMSFAVFFLVCVAAALFVYGVIGRLAANIRFFRTVKIIINILFLIWLLSFVIAELFIITGMRDDSDTSADYLIVLGAGLHGETPSLTLAGRLDKAAAYLKEHENAVVIVSGGQGPGESITEAEAMRRYLETDGIAPERIVKEEKSRNTNGNIVFSGDIIREMNGFDGVAVKVCVISSDFHLFRARLLAKRYGFEPVCIGSHLPLPWLQATYILREYFSVMNALTVRY